MLEIQRSSEAVSDRELEKLRGERGKLTQQLKRKVQERVDLFRKDSDHALDNLANHFQSYNKKQVRTKHQDVFFRGVYVNEKCLQVFVMPHSLLLCMRACVHACLHLFSIN